MTTPKQNHDVPRSITDRDIHRHSSDAARSTNDAGGLVPQRQYQQPHPAPVDPNKIVGPYLQYRR
jgi:hypothetical protein